ncbi:MAG: glycoside hydrolase family 3 protein [Oscillospiraceae bacterium]|nr:glycoside hydrolase family 3 protein [Oscillospiraceae bacterium]
MKKHMRKAIALILALVLAVSAAVGTFAVSDMIADGTKEDALRIAKQIQAEGTVLVENKDGLLPLANKKVSVFGITSYNPNLGGGGSGSIEANEAIDLFAGLTAAGIEYNSTVYDVYKSYIADKTSSSFDNPLISMVAGLLGSSIDEYPVENIDQSVFDSAKSFSDTAIISFGKAGSEMSDLSADDLRLSDTERALLDKVCHEFSNVIVIFNSSNIYEMDWIEDYPSIKAVLLTWLTGEVGFDSVAKIISGDINPSGKLPDSIAYKIEDYPTTPNFGSFKYKNTLVKSFVNYAEDIYLGYRYFETFAPEKVMYPFGYGLSYTTFDWEPVSYSDAGDNITVKVKVTNTGSVAGKDVVEVYFSAPYTKGGIEKSAVELAGYAKTGELAPGKSETVTVTFAKRDMSSYSEKEQAYVLEKGNYEIKIGHSCRDFEAVYNFKATSTKVYKTDDVTGKEIKNLFGDIRGDFPLLSRAGTDTMPLAPTNYVAPDEVLNCDVRPDAIEGEVPKTGVNYESGVIKLADVYADESLWDAYLDQFTLQEMIDLICESGYKTAAVERLGLPATVDNDGPGAVKGDGGLLYSEVGLGFPAETVIAATWNDALAEEYGEVMGQQAWDLGVHVWYAPGCNLHRHPCGGRNFEYFSEDPLLSGKMAAAVIRGAQSKGIIPTVKHFVCDEQETNKLSYGIFTWLSEQALRELYLRPFEIAVKEGHAKGIMTAYNRIGPYWCSGYKTLVTDLLCEEWGYDGFIVTDAYINVTGSGYMDPVLAIYAGNDALLTSLWYFAEKIQFRINLKSTYQKDPVGFGQALRNSTYGICKMVMQTAAFDPTDTTGNTGGAILDYENEEIVNSHNPSTPDNEPTNPANPEAPTDAENPSNVGDPNTPNTAVGTNNIFTAKKAVTVAAVAASVAAVTGVTAFAVKRKKEEEEIPQE